MRSPSERFQPMILTSLKGYSVQQLGRDVGSGLVVAIIALPLSLAFAINSGLSPSQGLLTAAIGGFIISLLGGSRVQIGGPAGAFIPLVYSIVEKYQWEGLIIATLMAGIILLVLGLIKAGSLIRYIPEPIIVGFSAGIAVVILISQLKDALGLDVGKVPGEFFEKIPVLFQAIPSANFWAIGLCLGTVAIIYLFRHFFPRIPGAFVALVSLTLLAALAQIPANTIGSVFGDVQLALVPPALGKLSLPMILDLFPAALAIAGLGAIESLLCAMVSDGMIGDRHRSNTELVAQGIANIAVAFAGGMPCTGTIARTMANVRNGCRSPIAGISHAIFVFLITAFLARFAAYIPLAVLAGILVYVALNMAEWGEFVAIARSGKSEAAVILVTFLLTVCFDLSLAIGVGLLLSAVFFIRDMAAHSRADVDTDQAAGLPEAPEGVRLIQFSGAFFFGASALFEETLAPLIGKHRCLVLDCSRLTMIDNTGLRVIRTILQKSARANTFVVLNAIPAPVAAKLDRSGVIHYLEGHGIISSSLEEAYDFARRFIGSR